MLVQTILKDELRLLTFRAPSAQVREHPGAYLAFGLALTWLAGIGRHWNNADMALWQHLGLGSLAYVFLLALILWLAVAPLKPRHWSYRNVLLFIALTAPPALLYAIPVESIVASSTALEINGVFLAAVALWRVALLFVFLNRVAGMGGFAIVVAALLPLAVIVDGLTILNLEHVVYQLMIRLPDPDGADGDGAHTIVQAVCAWSALVTPALLARYGWTVYARRTVHDSGSTRAAGGLGAWRAPNWPDGDAQGGRR